MDLAYHPDMHKTVVRELGTTLPEMPYFEIVRRNIYVHSKNEGEQSIRVMAVVLIVRCAMSDKGTLSEILMKGTTETMGLYAYIPMAMVSQDKKGFINQIRLHNKTTNKTSSTTVYGLHPHAMECQGTWMNHTGTLRQLIHGKTTTKTEADSSIDKETRVIMSVEITRQTHLTGEHKFTYQEDLKKEANQLIQQVCETYNALEKATEVKQEFLTITTRAMPTLKTDFKNKLREDSKDLEKYNALSQKRKQQDQLCFEEKPPSKGTTPKKF